MKVYHFLECVVVNKHVRKISLVLTVISNLETETFLTRRGGGGGETMRVDNS